MHTQNTQNTSTHTTQPHTQTDTRTHTPHPNKSCHDIVRVTSGITSVTCKRTSTCTTTSWPPCRDTPPPVRAQLHTRALTRTQVRTYSLSHTHTHSLTDSLTHKLIHIFHTHSHTRTQIHAHTKTNINTCTNTVAKIVINRPSPPHT